MNTNEGETVRDVCAKMLEPSSTCRACDFTQCPMLVKFAAEVNEAHEREMAAKNAEIARLRAALKPVMKIKKQPVLGLLYKAECAEAVLEAQRVMREGGAK